MRLPASVRSAGQHLLKLWVSMQVSHRGKYSVERTLALEEYIHSTSTTRALLVVLCTPLPVLIGALAVEALPLAEPSAGWSANYVTWIRTAFLTAALAFLAGLDVRHLLPGRPISNVQVALLTLVVTVVYMPMAIAVAALWAFPIPFMTVVMSTPYSLVCILTLRWMIGTSGIDRLRTQSPGAILRHAQFVHANGALVVVYPAFQALFSTASGTHYQLVLLLLVLPMITISLKQLVARRAAHLDDLIPELVVVSVEMFNALYLATCVQRINSAVTAVTVVAFDVAQNVVALRGIHMRTSRVWGRHRQMNEPNWRGDLLTAVRTLIIAPRRLDSQALAGIQLRSCVPHELSDKSSEVLRSLEQGRACFFTPPRVRATRQIVPHVKAPRSRRSSQTPGASRAARASAAETVPTSLSSVVPADASVRAGPRLTDAQPTREANAVGPTTTTVSPIVRRFTRKSTLLLDSQRVLFTIEYVVLAEYFELFSPFFYAGYIASISRLPSAKYHAELAGLSGSALSKTLTNNLLFALLKLASFALLVLMLRRVSGHDALRHLAFVLETRMVHVQAKMVVWILMVTGFRIVHFGESMLCWSTNRWLDLTDSLLMSLQAWTSVFGSSGCTVTREHSHDDHYAQATVDVACSGGHSAWTP